VANLLEKVDHFKFMLFSRHIRLHLCIGIIHDCKEHVEKNEENKEYIKHEISGSKYSVGIKKFIKIEVSQKNAELREPEKKTTAN
jgi:hypothetical protein